MRYSRDSLTSCSLGSTRIDYRLPGGEDFLTMGRFFSSKRAKNMLKKAKKSVHDLNKEIRMKDLGTTMLKISIKGIGNQNNPNYPHARSAQSKYDKCSYSSAI